MLLIHKALRTEAARLEKLTAQLVIGDSLQAFRLAFNTWLAALVYHLVQEDQSLSTLLTFPKAAHNNGASGLASPGANGRSPSAPNEGRLAMIVREHSLHQDLTDCVEDVLAVLNEEIGRTSIITRTKQHLYMQVVALGIIQEDHLETDETIMMPRLREQLGEQEQLRLARALLTDEEAQDPRWVMDWVKMRLNAGERRSLEELEKRFRELPAAVA
jgi:hypothetical protein